MGLWSMFIKVVNPFQELYRDASLCFSKLFVFAGTSPAELCVQNAAGLRASPWYIVSPPQVCSMQHKATSQHGGLGASEEPYRAQAARATRRPGPHAWMPVCGAQRAAFLTAGSATGVLLPALPTSLCLATPPHLGPVRLLRGFGCTGNPSLPSFVTFTCFFLVHHFFFLFFPPTWSLLGGFSWAFCISSLDSAQAELLGLMLAQPRCSASASPSENLLVCASAGGREPSLANASSPPSEFESSSKLCGLILCLICKICKNFWGTIKKNLWIYSVFVLCCLWDWGKPELSKLSKFLIKA